MKTLLEKLSVDFQDGEYAHAYMESQQVARLAAQIRVLRKMRGWSQEELSEKSGIAQERISKIESADFNSLTLKTLNKFSKAFDVNLAVSFQSFSEAILDTVNLNAHKLEVDPRDADLNKFKIESIKSTIEGSLYRINAQSIGIVTKPFSAKVLDSEKIDLNRWQKLDGVSCG